MNSFQNNLLGASNENGANLDEEIYNQSVQLNKEFQSRDGMAKALTKTEDKSSVQKLLSHTLVTSFRNLGEIKKYSRELLSR